METMNPQALNIFQLAGWSIAIWFVIRSIWKYDANEKKLIELAINSATHWEQCAANYRSSTTHFDTTDATMCRIDKDVSTLKNNVTSIEIRLVRIEEKCKLTNHAHDKT